MTVECSKHGGGTLVPMTEMEMLLLLVRHETYGYGKIIPKTPA